jgi:hypothetical protein
MRPSLPMSAGVIVSQVSRSGSDSFDAGLRISVAVVTSSLLVSTTH